MATTADNQAEERLIAAEEALAHQAKMIEDLSAMVSKQWDAIDRLERRLALLTGQIEELADNMPAPPASQKPPHW